jgi:hypothetical protein
LVWDGEQWVKHVGMVARGAKKIVRISGIEVTPDHLILTGKIWKPAHELVSNEKTRRLALETGSENLPSLDTYSGTPEVCRESWSGALVEHQNTPYSITTCAKEEVLGAVLAQKRKRVTGEKNIGDTRTLYRIKRYSGASPRVLTDAETLKTLGIQITAVEGSPFIRRGCLIGERFCPTSLHSLDGITRTSNLTESTSNGDMSREICDSSAIKTTNEISAPSADCKNESENWKQVYDLRLAGPRNRFTIITDDGPMIVHNCGYGGGVGAYITFAMAYGLDLEAMAEGAWGTLPGEQVHEAEGFYEWAVKKKLPTFGLSERAFVVCDVFKRLWRAAHLRTSSFWGEPESAVRQAINQPGNTFTCRKLRARRDGAWLRIALPSGRALCYPFPRVDSETDEISYMGQNQYTRKWTRIKTYGGKLAENITQATARDVMYYAMPEIEKSGLNILLTVHDEVICESNDEERFTPTLLSDIMIQNTEWSQGLPLAAAGFETYRYRKG